jgi:hypothetical protein
MGVAEYLMLFLFAGGDESNAKKMPDIAHARRHGDTVGWVDVSIRSLEVLREPP